MAQSIISNTHYSRRTCKRGNNQAKLATNVSESAPAYSVVLEFLKNIRRIS